MFEVGYFAKSAEMTKILSHVEKGIYSIQNPSGSGSFGLHPEEKGNGVKPIKESFISTLAENGWISEARVDFGVTERPGPIDAVYSVGNKFFAVEWETGNIASSHRAINKMVVGILKGILVGGILVLPSREMYKYLTDRVGNYRELEPYFPVWEAANYKITEGTIKVIEIEHDFVSLKVPKITKGTDGRALR